MTESRQSDIDGFEIFPWNRNFETGLEEVDNQHRELVNILNRLARHATSASSDLTSSHLLDDLLGYASYHFSHEEGVWEETLGKSEMSRNHHDSHQMFFARIQMFRQSKDPHEDVLAALFDYLTRWLAFHILESDRRMAMIVKSVNAGMSVQEAKEKTDAELSASASVLVTALLEIYGKLSASTIQLMKEKMARHRAEDELERLRKVFESGSGSPGA